MILLKLNTFILIYTLSILLYVYCENWDTELANLCDVKKTCACFLNIDYYVKKLTHNSLTNLGFILTLTFVNLCMIYMGLTLDFLQSSLF